MWKKIHLCGRRTRAPRAEVRRPQRASLQRHPRGPRTRRWPERARAGGRWQRRASRGTGSEAWALLGGLQVAIPFQERGQDREPHPASGPSAARCGADGGGRWRPRRPGSSLPGLCRPHAELRPRALRSFPAECIGPPDRREVSGARLTRSWPPRAGVRPAPRRSVTAARFRSGAVAQAGPGTGARPGDRGEGGGGGGRSGAGPR